jgi:hypothetical protein
MARKPSIKSMIAKLERYKRDLAKTRDALRDLEWEMQAHADNAEEAMDDLSLAIDHLSELV